jgi:hypothetical protein
MRRQVLFALIFLLLSATAPTFADTNAENDYVKKEWETFHRLFDNHNFKTKDCLLDRCTDLLKKFQTGNFTFVPPLEYGDTPRLPTYVKMRKHCNRDLGIIPSNDIPVDPRRGFALYKVPAKLTRPKVKDLFLFRSEDYTDSLGGIRLPGAVVPFTYPECHSLKELAFEKTNRASPSVPQPDSMIEPIVIDDALLIMNLYVIIDSGPKPPLYVLTVWSIPAPTALTGEMYDFNGR